MISNTTSFPPYLQLSSSLPSRSPSNSKGQHRRATRKPLLKFLVLLLVVGRFFHSVLVFSEENRPALLARATAQDAYEHATMHPNLVHLLEKRATWEDRTVLVTAATYEYRKHLLNLKCNLDRVNMTDHYVIAALDEDLYDWAQTQGLPVFQVDGLQVASNASSQVFFLSEEFRRTTKLKPRIVLHILLAGYSVLWTDVDITWFQHPFEAFRDYMDPSFESIAIQSDTPLIQKHPERKDIKPHPSTKLPVEHEPKRTFMINSGCYLAKSNHVVVDAFQRIVEHAKSRDYNDQPSFNAVLCGSPSIRQETQCEHIFENRRVLNVTVLDRFAFPNGAVLVGEDNLNVYNLGKEVFETETGIPLSIAHNNWIVGSANKEQRQTDRGWWFIEEGQDSDEKELYTCKA